MLRQTAELRFNRVHAIQNVRPNRSAELPRRVVMRQAFIVGDAGTMIGLAGALVGSRLLTPMLFGVTALDPAALAGNSALLLAVAAGAAYIPARRATTIDPAKALRAD